MNFYDVLAAEKWDGGIPTINFFDLLFAQSMGGGKNWQTYEGTLPATINTNGDDMRQYQIYGNIGGVGEEVDITGLSEPLCGIQTYTDSLDLSTGILTRRIKKLVFDGTENWAYQSAYTHFTLNLINAIFLGIRLTPIICTHYIAIYDGRSITDIPNDTIYIGGSTVATQLAIKTNDYTTIADFKSFLAAQYAAETPVTVWYVLEEPEVSTITVPSGLTGAIEGYLIQDGTPTPETPIYPTSNGGKQADDTYSIPYGYKLDMVSRSRNLFDWNWLVDGYHLSPETGIPVENSRRTSILQPIQINSATGAFLSYVTVGNNNIKAMYSVFANDDTLIRRVTNISSGNYLNLAGGSKLYIAFYDSFSSSVAITKTNVSNVMLNVGSNALPYEPYSNTTTPIYIGSDPLNKDEYVDFGEQKVYRMINGTLTPTYPPVSLPALPTCEGTTIVDYVGSGAVPEKVYFEYQGGEQP